MQGSPGRAHLCFHPGSLWLEVITASRQSPGPAFTPPVRDVGSNLWFWPSLAPQPRGAYGFDLPLMRPCGFVSTSRFSHVLLSFLAVNTICGIQRPSRQADAMAAQDLSLSTESNGSALVITASTMLVLTWISVSLRVYVRGFLIKGFLLDDWFMVASQVR